MFARRAVALIALAALAALAWPGGTASAQVAVSVGIPVGGYHHPYYYGPRIYAAYPPLVPRAVLVAPAPVVVAPAPVVVAPAPVVVAPAPAPVVPPPPGVVIAPPPPGLPH